jgi:DNA polymerase III epsilon subunit-like protein
MQALEYDDGPLVWVCPLYTHIHNNLPDQRPVLKERRAKKGPNIQIDCEMTGLNAFEDKIIEIAVIITNGHLEPVDEGIEFIIKTDKSVLDK